MKARLLHQRTERHAARRACQDLRDAALASLTSLREKELELSRRLCWLTQAQALAVLFDLEIVPDNQRPWCYSIERAGIAVEELVEIVRDVTEEVLYAS